MLNVSKIQTNLNFGSGMLYSRSVDANYTDTDKLSNYKRMNRDVYRDYVDGDISFAQLLLTKINDFWDVLTQRNPKLELKAQMIEQDLLREGQRELENSKGSKIDIDDETFDLILAQEGQGLSNFGMVA